MGFSDEVSNFVIKTGTTTDQTVAKVDLDLFKDLVMQTPVKTGLAQSNYFPSIERDEISVETTASPGGAPSLERAGAFFPTVKAGGIFYITNNLPYILPITEYGHSTQMASGGLSLTVADWQSRVDRIAGTV